MQVVTLLSGPLLALIPILVWELSVKPWQERQRLVRGILAEIRLNFSTIAAHTHSKDRPNVYLVYKPLTLALQSTVAQNAGLFPEEIGRYTLLIYQRFQELNRHRDQSHDLWEQLCALPEDESTERERLHLTIRLATKKVNYMSSSTNALELMQVLIPALEGLVQERYVGRRKSKRTSKLIPEELSRIMESNRQKDAAEIDGCT